MGTRREIMGIQGDRVLSWAQRVCFLAGLLLATQLELTGAQLSTGLPGRCLSFFRGKSVSWMAVFHNETGSGTANYYTNGTLVTYAPDGVTVVNSGNYTIKDVRFHTLHLMQASLIFL